MLQFPSAPPIFHCDREAAPPSQPNTATDRARVWMITTIPRGKLALRVCECFIAVAVRYSQCMGVQERIRDERMDASEHAINPRTTTSACIRVHLRLNFCSNGYKSEFAQRRPSLNRIPRAVCSSNKRSPAGESPPPACEPMIQSTLKSAPAIHCKILTADERRCATRRTV